MLFVALALTLVGGLTVARHLAEPSCPSCSAKHWSDHPPRLECAECGWTTMTAAPSLAADARPVQYEIGLSA